MARAVVETHRPQWPPCAIARHLHLSDKESASMHATYDRGHQERRTIYIFRFDREGCKSAGVERGIYFGGPLFCARDVMADHETIRKVECYRKELTKVMLLLGEIIRNHQMNMLMIQFVVAHSRWKWFKGCLGALDGTYINVRVPIADAPRPLGLKVPKGCYYLCDNGYANSENSL
ncbi:protein ANTAGONIST OF LIKE HETEROCHROMATIN PROTEIN 1-like [Salvia divinorum]|uniref:Protein ANTAGONIST OF LIKE HETEROCHROMATIN PROTEIN 1-like n=1 Tax=Salvia divinorum TaxID=28513 RepID=A0ABD1H2U2_SALDI